MSGEPARAEAGFVLLIVLWWLVFLGFVTTQIIADTGTAMSVAADLRSGAVAETEADGAVNVAIFQVLARHWNADGTLHLIQGPQAVSEVRVDDEGGRIDPNVAPAILMQALLRQCGAGPNPAVELAAAISEWRSIDLRQSSSTAKALQYKAAGRGYLPPNSRFVSVDELALVLGMTPALFDCLEPHVSVFSLSVPTVQTAADPLVRKALAEAYPFDTPQPVAAAAHEVAVIRVTATARAEGGGQFRRVAVVRVAPAEPDDHFVYQILFWD